MSKLIADQLQGFTDPTIITGPTPPVNDNSTRLATTAFVQTAASSGWTPNPSFNVIYPTSILTNVAIGKTTAAQALDVVGNGAFSGSVFLGTPLNLASGGTGLNAIGGANTLLGVNPPGTGLEYKFVSSFLGTLSIGNSSGSLVLDVVNNTSNQKVQGLLSGTLVGTRKGLNFSSSFTVADNPGSDRLDIGFAAGAGVITGSGVVGEVSFFTGTSGITSSSNLLWDNVANVLTVIGAYALLETTPPAIASPGYAKIYADNFTHKTYLSQNSSLYSALVLESRNVGTGLGLAGGGNLSNDLTIAVVPNSTVQQVKVDKNGTLQATRKEINLIEGTGVTLSVVDNSGADRVDVTINSATAGYSIVENNAIALTQRSTLNFPGGALSAADNAISSRTDVTLAMTPTSASVVGSGRTISTGTGLSGGGALTSDLTLAVVPASTLQLINVDQSGTVISTRKELNFIPGTNVTITVTDNAIAGRADVSISATAGAGGVSSLTNSDGTLSFAPSTGAVVGSLNLGNANVWTAKQSMPSSTTGSAGFNVGGAGAAPTSPLSGDMYATAGPHLFYYDGTMAHDLLAAGSVTSVSNSDGTLTISPTSGAVIASLDLGNPNSWTAEQTFAASTSAHASINIPSGMNVTTPNNGDVFYNGTNLYFYNGSSNIDLLAPPPGGTGFAAKVAAAAQTINNSLGTVTYSAVMFDSTGTQTDGTGLVCQSTGYYQVNAYVGSGGAGALIVNILINGAVGSNPNSIQIPAVPGFDTIAGVSTILFLTSGDTVRAQAQFTTSGGTSDGSTLLSFAKL